MRVDRRVVRIQHFHVHAREVARVLAHMRRDLGLRDRRRHRPGGIEVDAGDFGGQRRRGFFGLADDHAIAPHHFVVLDGLGGRRRQIDHDIALPERKVHVFDALERGLDLPDPLLHGDIERGQRSRRYGAGRREAVAVLETHHGLGDFLVEQPGRPLGGEIAGDDQALAQQIVVRPRRTHGEFGVGGNCRPAAAHRNVGIAQRGFLDSFGGAFVEGRFMRQRQRRRRA